MHGSLVSQPIFLVGAERSGTTLLRLMLNNHPELSWCNEFEYAIDLISDKQNWPKLDNYYSWLETHRVFQATHFKIDHSLDYPELVNSFLIQKQTNDGKNLVGATVHRHFDRLIKIWPEAKFIHILRDGRDVARSCIGMGWAGNVWTGVERWIEAENLWEKFSKSLSEEKKFEITYESLISNSSEVLQKICNFIGIPFDSNMLTYNQTTTYDLPDPKLIQQWKNKLTDREIQLIESRISKMLAERNYKLSNLPQIKVTSVMEKKLKLQDWFQRLQFRIKRFGLPLFIADNLSRRFHLYSWQKKVKLEMNSIQKSYLK